MKKSLIIVFLVIIINSCKSEIETKMKNDSFKNFLVEIESSKEEKKQNLADQFISSLTNNYPYFEDDSTVVFFYQGKEDSVLLLGDMGNWVDKYKFTKILGTDLFYYRGKYEPTALLQYWLHFSDDKFPIVDPLNPYIVRNGWGKISELAMPKYQRHEYFKDFIQGEIGDFDLLKEDSIDSKYLNYKHTIHIYLPPNYESENKNYSTVYFQDGKDYIEFAIAPFILDNLIKEKRVEPIIGIFITPPNLHQPKVPNRSTEYGLNDDYVSFFVNELVPHVDKTFRTKKDANNRLVVGDSYGGLISLYISFMKPDIFGLSYSQSGYHSFQSDKLINLIRDKEKKAIRTYIDVGTYEEVVGAAFIPEAERNFTEGNRRLKQVLKEKKYDFVYIEYYAGHTWSNWRRHLIDALIHFFGEQE